MKRIYQADFTVPAGTAIAAPVSQPVVLADAHLETVRFIIPDGHAGLTGLRITWAGTQIFPYNTGTWLISDDEVFDWPADQEVTANGLSLAGYNTDIFAHTFHVRFQIGPRVPNQLAGIQSGQLDLAATAASTADVSQLATVNVPVTDATAIDTGVPVTP